MLQTKAVFIYLLNLWKVADQNQGAVQEKEYCSDSKNSTAISDGSAHENDLWLDFESITTKF